MNTQTTPGLVGAFGVYFARLVACPIIVSYVKLVFPRLYVPIGDGPYTQILLTAALLREVPQELAVQEESYWCEVDCATAMRLSKAAGQ